MSARRLRIIGGEWRSRPIEFPDVSGIRPTPDRIRETLFNWLRGSVHGARCLELFCGSGVLSLEACSRGASYCLAIDQSAEAVSAIKQRLIDWHIESSRFHCEKHNARDWLAKYTGEPFDLIFLDPPFADTDIAAIIEAVARPELLFSDGLIYVETPEPLSPEHLPQGLEIYRQKRAGAVHYCLLAHSVG